MPSNFTLTFPVRSDNIEINLLVIVFLNTCKTLLTASVSVVFRLNKLRLPFVSYIIIVVVVFVTKQ